MDENPYKAPLVAGGPSRSAVADNSGTILRLLLAWQIIAIAVSGLWARNEAALGFLAGAVVATIPINALLVPLVVLWLARKQSSGRGWMILLVQVALWGCYFIALLPSVQ